MAKKIESNNNNKSKYDTFYSNSKANINESDINDGFESIYI